MRTKHPVVLEILLQVTCLSRILLLADGYTYFNPSSHTTMNFGPSSFGTTSGSSGSFRNNGTTALFVNSCTANRSSVEKTKPTTMLNMSMERNHQQHPRQGRRRRRHDRHRGRQHQHRKIGGGRSLVSSATSSSPSSSSSFFVNMFPRHGGIMKSSSASTIADSNNKNNILHRLVSLPRNWIKSTPLTEIDLAIVVMYFCGCVAINAPIVLLPIVASEVATASAAAAAAAAATTTTTTTAAAAAATTTITTTTAMTATSFAVKVTSFSTFGSALGKLINGFVCQYNGGRKSSYQYLLGLALFAAMFSCVPTTTAAVATAGTATKNAAKNAMYFTGFSNAAMDFCHSILWTASTTVFAKHYENDTVGFTRGITALSLSSTAAALTSKIGFSYLLATFGATIHWRTVSRMAAIFALGGAITAYKYITDAPRTTFTSLTKGEEQRSEVSPSSFSLKEVLSSSKSILGHPLFWIFGLAHASAFVVRTSDKVIGAFLNQITTIPISICGGFTSSITIGFVHGLISGNAFNSMTNISKKKKFLRARYAKAVLAAFTLAACATTSMKQLVGNGILLASMIALASGVLASNIAFQFYQLPPFLANSEFFKSNKSVCTSFLDGLGFFASSFIWAATGRITSSSGRNSSTSTTSSTIRFFGISGWPLAWTFLGMIFAAGGGLMMNALPKLLKWDEDSTSSSSSSSSSSSPSISPSFSNDNENATTQ